MRPASSKSIRRLDIAVGILGRDDGRVLMAKRPAGKPWAGYWEFPGGKIESGESTQAALVRELHEELGIELELACPWITREYAYPDRHVRLHIYRVVRWHGEPHGREGQQLAWELPHAVQSEPLLPANHQLLHALSFPAIYAITQASQYGADTFIARLRSALGNGIKLIQVRERMETAQLDRFTHEVVSLAHNHGARVLVNGDAELAGRCDADGIHLQSAELMRLQKLPDHQIVAASCHNREELLRAAGLGVDFVVLSPVLPTPSHPGEATLGWQQFAELCQDMPMPVYALGGMRPDLLETAMTHRAHGIAMLSGVW